MATITTSFVPPKGIDLDAIAQQQDISKGKLIRRALIEYVAKLESSKQQAA